MTVPVSSVFGLPNGSLFFYAHESPERITEVLELYYVAYEGKYNQLSAFCEDEVISIAQHSHAVCITMHMTRASQSPDDFSAAWARLTFQDFREFLMDGGTVLEAA